MKMYLRHMKVQELPEAGIGGIKLLGGIGGLTRTGLLSFASTTTTSEVRKDFATTAACSMQHLTTWWYLGVWEDILHHSYSPRWQRWFKMSMTICLQPLMDPVFQQPSSPHSGSWQHCNHNLCCHSITPFKSNNQTQVRSRWWVVQKNLRAQLYGALAWCHLHICGHKIMHSMYCNW